MGTTQDAATGSGGAPEPSAPQRGTGAPVPILPPAPQDPPTRSDRLKQYEILLGQLRFETTIMWTRLGFMMVAQAALLGFFANAIEKIDHAQGWPVWWRTLCEFGFPLLGGALLLIFHRMKRATDWWVDRWLVLLREYEGTAFSERNLMRETGAPSSHPPGSTRKLGHWLFVPFAVLWFFVMIGVLVNASGALGPPAIK